MKRFMALMMCALSLGAAAQIEYPFPYNPDSDNSGWIGLSDLLSLLAVYNTQFEPDTWQTDSLSAHVDLQEQLNYVECISACNKLPGAWRMSSLDEFGRGLDVLSSANEYWVSSNAAVANGTLISARLSGRVETYSATAGEQLKGCLCYIRANTFSQPSASTNASLSNIVADLDSIFQQVEALGASLELVEEQLVALDSIGSTASSDTSVNASLGQAILSCIDFGLHSQCSPQGGFCDNVSTDPTSDGRYTVTSSCQVNYDPNQCVSPNWRKFRIVADGIGHASHLNILSVGDGYSGSNPNTYPSKFNQSSIPFDVVSDDVIEFFAGHNLSDSGLTGFGVSSSSNTSWTQVHHPMSVVIEGRHYFLPFGLRF